MDVWIGTLLALSLQFSVTFSVHVSGTITENVTFFYRKLPVAQSVRATIEFSISYSRPAMGNKYPSMGINTSYPKVNIEKRCTYQHFGQLRNENLYPHLRPGRRYRTTKCGLSGDDTVSCRGRVDVQDYIPRTFYLTFGFLCNLTPMYSLNGLSYNITFSQQSNGTNECTDYSKFPSTGAYSRFYNETSVPNLIGNEDINTIVSYFKQSRIFEVLFLEDESCYQHLMEFTCYIILPQCDPITQQVINPCREMCSDFLDGCQSKLMYMFRMDSEF